MPFVERIDISNLDNVEGAWSLEGALTDRGPNNLPLSLAAGTLSYADVKGKHCAYVEPACRLERPGNDAALTIIGALTVHVLFADWGFQAGANSHLFSFVNTGAARPGANYLYSIYANGLQDMHWFSESGAAASTDVKVGGFTPAEWTLHTITRNGTTGALNYYANGRLITTAASTLPVAGDGATSRMGVGCRSGSNNSAWSGFYGDCVVQSEEMAAADILAVARQVGTAAPA